MCDVSVLSLILDFLIFFNYYIIYSIILYVYSVVTFGVDIIGQNGEFLNNLIQRNKIIYFLEI